jgi:cell division GTPase FtsZ
MLVLAPTTMSDYAAAADVSLFEVDEAATRVREEVDADASIMAGATFDDALDGRLKVSAVITGLRQPAEVVFLAEAHRMTLRPLDSRARIGRRTGTLSKGRPSRPVQDGKRGESNRTESEEGIAC